MVCLRRVLPFLLASVVALLAQAPQLNSHALKSKQFKSALESAHLSHVRIVRVSLAQGPVQINQDGRGWQRLNLNAPISEGDEVRTGDAGRAVIELEGGSTVKLIPNSVALFQRLALDGKGTRLSDVAITQGTAYFSLASKDAEGFRALFPEGVVTTDGSAEFRVAVNGAQGQVTGLGGQAEVATANDSYLLKKNDQLQVSQAAPAALAKSKTRDTWDQWSASLDQQARASSLKAELDPYGTWRGNWWYPSIAMAGWNPFMNGMWFFDPAMGYVWDSFYPWGWDPFHFGMWWDSPLGWAWSPFGGDLFAGAPMFWGNGVLGPGWMAPPMPPPPPAPTPHHQIGILAIRSGGAVAPARVVGTQDWYRARALGGYDRAGISGRAAMRTTLNAEQMAAMRRAHSSFGHDRERIMGPRIMREAPMGGWQGAGVAASSGLPPSARPAATMPSPVAMPSPAPRVSAPRVPK